MLSNNNKSQYVLLGGSIILLLVWWLGDNNIIIQTMGNLGLGATKPSSFIKPSEEWDKVQYASRRISPPPPSPYDTQSIQAKARIYNGMGERWWEKQVEAESLKQTSLLKSYPPSAPYIYKE